MKFVESGSAAEHNIDGDYLRLHSRKANCLDCSHVLRPGADVCVKQANSREEANPSVRHLTISFFKKIILLRLHFVTSSTCMASSHMPLLFSYEHRYSCIVMQGLSKSNKNITQTSASAYLLLCSTKTSVLAAKEK